MSGNQKRSCSQLTRIANFYLVLGCINCIAASCSRLINLSLFEQVTAVEFTKMRKQYLAFTLDKIGNSGELKGVLKSWI